MWNEENSVYGFIIGVQSAFVLSPLSYFFFIIIFLWHDTHNGKDISLYAPSRHFVGDRKFFISLYIFHFSIHFNSIEKSWKIWKLRWKDEFLQIELKSTKYIFLFCVVDGGRWKINLIFILFFLCPFLFFLSFIRWI